MTVLQGLIAFGLIVLAVGVAASTLLLLDARLDVRAADSVSPSNGRGLVARTSLRTETLRLLSMLALAVSVATSAVTLWDAGEEIATTSRILAFAAFDLAAVAILVQSLEVYTMRRRLFDRYSRDEDDRRDEAGQPYADGSDSPPKE